MDRCNECIHYDVCDRSSMLLWHTMKGIEKCSHFADKDNVIEVVRCRDCVHCVVREYDIIDELECEFFDVFTEPLDYCSRGERKVNND